VASSVAGEKSLSGEKKGQKSLGYCPGVSSVFWLNPFETTGFFKVDGTAENSFL